MASASAPSSVGLGTADSFEVLGATTVTNTGPSTISDGDVGLSPGTSVVGFPPAVISGGVIHATDAQALGAQADVTTAYNDAAGRLPDVPGLNDLSGKTLTAGVYSGPTLGLTGTLTLSGGPSDVFIFQAGSTLITGSSSVVAFQGGASACNVFWQVGSSATLGSASVFGGTILAQASITANSTAKIEGRLFARTGAVTLDSNVITRSPGCAARSAVTASTPTADQVAAAAAAAAAATAASTAATVPSTVSSESTKATVPSASAKAKAAAKAKAKAAAHAAHLKRLAAKQKATSSSSGGGGEGSAGGSDSTIPQLPKMGTDIQPYVMTSMLLLASGGILLIIGRRRRHAAHRA